jgi:MFS family permease
MVSITLLLVAAAHASMTTAGLVVAGYTLGQAVTGPLRGRLADRHGLARVCAVCGCLYAMALACLLAGSLTGIPAGLLVAAAAAAGLVVPPLSPGMRSLWSARAADALRHTAFALDAAVFDLAYITGPVLASSLAAGVAPAAAVGVLLALTGAAVVIIGTHSRPGAARRGGRPVHARRPVLGALNSAALRRLLITGALVNIALSATEVALTAYARQHHALWASGPLLAEVSAGSIVGSLFLGARTSAARTAEAAYRRLPWLLARYGLGLAALTAASLYAPLVAVAAPLAGLSLGPSLATLFGLASSAAPDGGGTEAQAWLSSVMNGGAAAGAALAGATAGRPMLSLAVAAVAAAAGSAASMALGRERKARRGPWSGSGCRAIVEVPSAKGVRWTSMPWRRSRRTRSSPQPLPTRSRDCAPRWRESSAAISLIQARSDGWTRPGSSSPPPRRKSWRARERLRLVSGRPASPTCSPITPRRLENYRHCSPNFGPCLPMRAATSRTRSAAPSSTGQCSWAATSATSR